MKHVTTKHRISGETRHYDKISSGETRHYSSNSITSRKLHVNKNDELINNPTGTKLNPLPALSWEVPIQHKGTVAFRVLFFGKTWLPT